MKYRHRRCMSSGRGARVSMTRPRTSRWKSKATAPSGVRSSGGCFGQSETIALGRCDAGWHFCPRHGGRSLPQPKDLRL